MPRGFLNPGASPPGETGRARVAGVEAVGFELMDLTAYRDRFPILAETTYLINHSLGAMPAETEERLADYARVWRTRGIRAWREGWWTMPLELGDQIARIIGAAPGTTVMHQNVAVAEAIVLSCFRPVDAARNRLSDPQAAGTADRSEPSRTSDSSRPP